MYGAEGASTAHSGMPCRRNTPGANGDGRNSSSICAGSALLARERCIFLAKGAVYTAFDRGAAREEMLLADNAVAVPDAS